MTVPIATSPGAPASARSCRSPTTPAPATARSASAGASRCRRSRARPTRACRATTTPTSPTSSSSPAPRTWCRCSDGRTGTRRRRPRTVRGIDLPRSAATGRASKGCSRASSAGRTVDDRATCFWRSISQGQRHHLVRQGRRTAASPIRPIRDRIFSWLICETLRRQGQRRRLRLQAGGRRAASTSRQRTSATAATASPRAPTAISSASATATARPTSRRRRTGRAARRRSHRHAAGCSRWCSTTASTMPDAPDARTTTGTRGPAAHDPFSTYRAGFEVRTYRLCQRVLMFHHFPDEPGVGADCLVRSTDFAYADRRRSGRRRATRSTRSCVAVTQTGYRRERRRLPASVAAAARVRVQRAGDRCRTRPRASTPASLREPAGGLDGARLPLGRPRRRGHPRHPHRAGGRLVLQAQPRARSAPRTAAARHARGSRPSSRRPSRRAPSWRRSSFWTSPATASSTSSMLDGPRPASTSATTTRAGQPFRAVRVAARPRLARPEPAVRRPRRRRPRRRADHRGRRLRLAPLAGRGRLRRRPARARSRSTRRAGPRLVFADGTQSIYLADMSGDGLTDLVRIRNGEVCYWPNLGYGRFGAKVTMDNAPWFDAPDQFDHAAHPAGRHRRLAAPPTSSICDRDGVRLYFNQSGNGWSAAAAADAFPARRRPGVGHGRPTCSATAPPAWSGRRRCPATRGGRCATST